MSAITPAPVESTTTPAPSTTSLTTEINTAATVAAGIADVIPGAGPVAGLAIGGAAAIADLIVHMTSMYSQKVLTETQLLAMVKVAVSDYDTAVSDWNAAK